MIFRTGVSSIVLFLLVACSTQVKPSSIPTLSPIISSSPITPIPPSPRPFFLPALYPKQGDILSLSDYEMGNSINFPPYPDTIEPNAICVEIYAGKFLQEGDFWEYEDVYERTTILINNQPHQGQAGYEFIYALPSSSIRDSQGKELASVGGPYKWCVLAPLEVGTHRVDVSFEQSNGEITSFAWTFELVDGPVPTATPLPIPSEVNRTGLFPEFLVSVYPAPGEYISPTEDLRGRSDLKKVWGGMIVPGDDWKADYPTEPNRQPVCFALESKELRKIESLPNNSRDWPERIYYKIDENFLEAGVHGWVWSKGVWSHCAEIMSSPGEHIATIYLSPYQADLVTYSWAFTIEE